jgi:hypothetical protein
MVALFSIVGGALAAGSFLAWANMSGAGQQVSAKGTDRTDGYLTLVAGIILILYGVARLIGNAMGTRPASMPSPTVLEPPVPEIPGDPGPSL